MDLKAGQEYIELLKAGTDEDTIVQQRGISYEELYAAVSFIDQPFARENLKNFCSGCANDICFCWPMREETPCFARGYEPHCPLKKSDEGE